MIPNHFPLSRHILVKYARSGEKTGGHNANGTGGYFCTTTGNRDVISSQHFELMSDGVIIANAGHFDVEIDIIALQAISVSRRQIRPYVEQYEMPNGRCINIVPDDIHKEVARLKLDVTGVRIDTPTHEQEEYLSSWQTGT